MAEGITRVEYPEDPERCQAIAQHGQCMNRSLPDSKYCKIHAGGGRSRAEKQLANYRLTQARIRQSIVEKSSSSGIKSLRDEIGIARVVMESILDKCEDATDVMVYHSQIDKSLSTIKTLVEACHKLEQSLNLTLDKQAILVIVGQIVEAMAEVIRDTPITEDVQLDLINRVSDRLFDIVKSVE